MKVGYRVCQYDIGNPYATASRIGFMNLTISNLKWSHQEHWLKIFCLNLMNFPPKIVQWWIPLFPPVQRSRQNHPSGNNVGRHHAQAVEIREYFAHVTYRPSPDSRMGESVRRVILRHNHHGCSRVHLSLIHETSERCLGRVPIAATYCDQWRDMRFWRWLISWYNLYSEEIPPLNIKQTVAENDMRFNGQD